ncbi:MazG nucleotide pyrophosphohydrolase domain-containing protein [Sphingobium sp. HBC34]|uniref:MazG nucleotide pyrophosphohydrolase domain-containing protein n=1 Tax=Sphingobium cyanobacteriorum TaxID=3063954 RepID=A0ABT8ZSC8_9SPHN|nr:MazG nucleotide pyrophosphohydrolase domain-containing protein [Sphingobium sp. HBC34]MDO7837096.1 MazG nucleotide pyrophosphohydrolase domain-containing protein [Sphingobium sp. HBC34]
MKIGSVQREVDAAIRSMGGYWVALASLARISEELGELAAAIDGGYKPQIEREAADVVVASVALANQYALDLSWTESVSFAECDPLRGALINVGQISRATNRFEGSKPPKPGERGVSLAAEFVSLFHFLAQIVGCSTTKLFEMAVDGVRSNALRDAKRFEGRIDTVTSPVRDTFVAFALAEGELVGPQIGVWGETAQMDAGSRKDQFARFLRVDAVAPLAAFVFECEAFEGAKAQDFDALGRTINSEFGKADFRNNPISVLRGSSADKCFIVIAGGRKLPRLRNDLALGILNTQ